MRRVRDYASIGEPKLDDEQRPGTVLTATENGRTGIRATSRRRVLRRSGAALGTGLAIGLAGCSALGLGSGESEPVDGVLVRMTSDFVYDPDSVAIRVGETVVWRTEGFTPHTVTAYEDGVPEDGEYFASGGYGSEQAARDGFADGGGEVGRNEEYEHTFEVAGTYEYFCIPHESSMVGTVTVEASE